MNIRFISAGAGSGKTYRITELLQDYLLSGKARPGAVIATTFTRKAASELATRVRQRLVGAGRPDLALQMSASLTGTVNSVCGQLLVRYAFEAGLSPQLETMTEDDAPLLFNQSLEDVLHREQIREMNALSWRLSQEDWRKTIKGIVDVARANNLSSEQIRSQAKHSSEELFAYLPVSLANDDQVARLSAAIADALAVIRDNGDTTKGTADYVALLEEVQRLLADRGARWVDWVNLAKRGPTKRSQAAAEAVQEIASGYERNPLFHHDLQRWIDASFTIAAAALERYQQFKAERGMMDFVDQEQQVLGLLDTPEVVDSLREQLDLLLVDEFQDTSPIQLAIFLKLAALARETIWVGDIKQAIYGFRGSDPGLMEAVLRGLIAQGTKIEVLGDSWRSRPPLVELVNELFAPAFESIPAEQVRLKPMREELVATPPVSFWMLEGGNKATRAEALADGVARLLAQQTEVIDKSTGKARPLREDDIAILCRSNDNVSGLAATFSRYGIPISVCEAGLLCTPEATLAIACLRWLIDRSDTLAAAEIIALQGEHAPEAWLTSRLEYLASGAPAWEWSFEDATLQRLDAERERLHYLTPTEALDHALTVGEVKRTALSWGPSAQRASQRLANLEALRQLALNYEEHCQSSGLAATVPGLLLWLQEVKRAKSDIRASTSTGAVEIITHHSAKGLEWPVVICTDLDTAYRTRVWGLSMRTTGEVSLHSPLANRQLRLWPWPFGRHSAYIPFKERVENGPQGKAAALAAIEEEKRLLYVSLTRPRDRLILALPATAKKYPWLDLLGAEWFKPGEILQPPSNQTMACEVLHLTSGEAQRTISNEELFWFPAAPGRTARLPLYRTPSAEPQMAASVGRVIETGHRLSFHGRPDMERVGNALHAAIAAEVTHPGHPERAQLVTELLRRHGVANVLETTEVIEAVDRMITSICDQLGATSMAAEVPLQFPLANGQWVNGWIDLLAETTQGTLLIDHKSFPGGRQEWEGHLLQYSGQLALYRRGLEATGHTVSSQWIALPVAGGLIEIVID